MTSQYALIASQWPELHEEAQRVEQFALSDPRTACFYARRTIELLVEWIYTNDAQLQRPIAAQTLADLMYARAFTDLAGEQMARFRLLKDLGNSMRSGAGTPLRKLFPAIPLTAPGFLYASPQATACDDDPSSSRDSRSGLADVAGRGQGCDFGSAGGDPHPAKGKRGASGALHRRGYRAEHLAGAPRPQLPQLLDATLQRRPGL